MENRDQKELMRDILLNYKIIAVVGMSRDINKPARKVPKFLMAHKYKIIPVNPFTDKILGRPSYKNLLEIPSDISIDVVEIFRPSEKVPPIVDQALERHKRYGDVKVIWMQEGIKNKEAAEKAKKEGIIVIEDHCMYKEYMWLIKGEEPLEM